MFVLAATLLGPAAIAASLPTIVCSDDQVLECTSAQGAFGVVNATVQDADGDGLLVVWTINGHAAQTNLIAAGGTADAITLSITNQFGHGTNDVSVGVTDDGENFAMCSSIVIVRDTTPPTIHSILATPNVLWPPNHKMRPVQVVVRATDTCGPVRWRITGITSNEAVDGLGDGQTSPDWLINGPHKALLRAERSGRHSGRIYTLEIEIADAADNTTNRSVQVFVPHDRGRGKTWSDDVNSQMDLSASRSGKAKKNNGHGKSGK